MKARLYLICDTLKVISLKGCFKSIGRIEFATTQTKSRWCVD
jgi:hypothetical protein